MQFQSIQGPTDSSRRHSLTEGYQPVSRIGETVVNCFVDAYEFAALDTSISHLELMGEQEDPEGKDALAVDDYKPDKGIEVKPHFHEWASVLPGMVCLSRKARNSTFRNYVAAETATPVIGCAACLKYDDMDNFYFAGVCRSKTVRPIDDGVGPQVDEFFTLAIGGMVTMLNNSGTAVFPGDMLAWTFYAEHSKKQSTSSAMRGKKDPRRISVELATANSERVIGRCLTFAKPNETFDLLLKTC